MGTYVIGDIHGCFDEFQKMLQTIGFSEQDRLYLTGDYIDRGPDSLKMLYWLEDCPANVTPVRGNHDEEFAAYVDLLRQIDAKWDLQTQPDSHDDLVALYDTAKYLFQTNGIHAALFFDLYGTINKLLRSTAVTLNDLLIWRDMIRRMPYYAAPSVHRSMHRRPCVVVHAGYRGSGFDHEDDAKDFYLYAREEAYRDGGVRHGMVVAGHTPTVLDDEFAYSSGRVFRYYDKRKDCVFYDIDCGCVFRGKYPNARLACIRLEDEAIFYV